jgi:hypothetical protein
VPCRKMCVDDAHRPIEDARREPLGGSFSNAGETVEAPTCIHREYHPDRNHDERHQRPGLILHFTRRCDEQRLTRGLIQGKRERVVGDGEQAGRGELAARRRRCRSPVALPMPGERGAIVTDSEIGDQPCHNDAGKARIVMAPVNVSP